MISHFTKMCMAATDTVHWHWLGYNLAPPQPTVGKSGTDWANQPTSSFLFFCRKCVQNPKPANVFKLKQKNTEEWMLMTQRSYPKNKGKLVMHLSWTRAIQAGFHLIDKILPNSPPGDQVLAVWSAPVLGPASGPATAVVASPGTQTHWALIHQCQLKMTHFWLGCCQPQDYFLNHLFINFEMFVPITHLSAAILLISDLAHDKGNKKSGKNLFE